MKVFTENNGTTNIIFLHGWGADQTSFYFLKDSITNCKLHFVCLDGFGLQPPPTDPTIQGYCNRLHSYITAKRLNNIILVGHSFGGRIAIEYAAKYKLLGLVLVDSAGITPKFSLVKAYRILQYKRLKKLVNAGKKHKNCLNKFGSTDYKNANSQMQQVLKHCVNYNQKTLLKSIKVFTLIIWGDHDVDTPIYMAKTLHKGIKSSKLILMPNCGHFSFLDNQYLFYKHLANYIKQQGEHYE